MLGLTVMAIVTIFVLHSLSRRKWRKALVSVAMKRGSKRPRNGASSSDLPVHYSALASRDEDEEAGEDECAVFHGENGDDRSPLIRDDHFGQQRRA